MKQYNAIKAKYPGALLLFRVGDFYETFGEDAETASKILGIVLTKRANGAASEVALAGFPHHALDNYLPKLIRAGKRVAVCDQLEDPKAAVGVVKRGVTELVTPGVALNDHVLDAGRNNYLAAVHAEKDLVGVAFLDVSTGEFFTAQGNQEYIQKLLQSFSPAEVLYNKQQRKAFEHFFGDKIVTYMQEDWVFKYEYAYDTLKQHFGTATLKGFGIEVYPLGIVAAGAVLTYLADTEHRHIGHITSISRLEEDQYVWLDKFTVRNLELLRPQQEDGVALIDILDSTVTPPGARLMRRWMVLPLKEKTLIEERLELTQLFKDHREEAQALRDVLAKIGDSERLISKVAVRRIGPREMAKLRDVLAAVPVVKNILSDIHVKKVDNGITAKLADSLHSCEFLRDKISDTLTDSPPLLANQGGVIREGNDEELDELRNIAFSGKDYLLQIQQREIERTGITSLKIAYNKVFGYYLEVTNAHKDKVPSDWIRKQTLVNAERYVTEELKTYEEKILNAESALSSIEQRIFHELVLSTSDFIVPIQQNAAVLAKLDCLLSFADSAARCNYVRPKLNEGKVLSIRRARHPVIERLLPEGEVYVPNDILLNDTDCRIMVITGPNMAGKSALLRQTALVVIMAQMGSFVPASSAEIGLVDKIFTRVGASDNISRGESTFMTEMTETAGILHNLSDRSLILMDEIGRGTSTYDGISIARAIVEYLHNHPKHRPKTLFATHYHELNELAGDFSGIKNYKIAVKETEAGIFFTRKLEEGGSEHSFGIHVAQMAGIPNRVVIRASEIMTDLEKGKPRGKIGKLAVETSMPHFQLKLFDASDPRFEEIKKLLEQTDINTISPVEALLKLNELKLLLENPLQELKN